MPTSAGAAPFRAPAYKGLSATGNVKTGAGVLHTIELSNLDAAVAWLQIFDAADSTQIVLGTTVPKLSLHVAASADADSADLNMGFNLGLVFAVTTTDGGAISPATGLAVDATYN